MIALVFVGKKTAHVTVHIRPELRERLDRWREAQPVKPQITACIEAALEQWLNSMEKKKKR